MSIWVSAEMQEGEDIEARQEGCGEGICLKDEDGPESVRVSIFFSLSLYVISMLNNRSATLWDRAKPIRIVTVGALA